jgi:hypothetical protein
LRTIYAIKNIIKPDSYPVKVNQSNMWPVSWAQLGLTKKNFIYILSKIDTFKIKNQQNIKVIEKQIKLKQIMLSN